MASKAHQATVRYVLSIYPDYYLSIGEDNKIVLWNSGTQITFMNSLSPDMLTFCGVFRQGELLEDHKAFGCQDSSQYCLTFTASKTSLKRFTNHACSGSSMYWIDFRALHPDQQVWVIHTGSSVSTVKIFDNNTVLCNTGNNHTAVDAAVKTCRFCGYNYPGCHFCSISSGCQTCGIGSYSVGNNCTSCPDECSDCTSPTQCSDCSMGYE